MLTYQDLREEARKRYPDGSSVWERIAFVNGAIFFMKKVCPEKESEMNIAYAVQDEK